MTDPQKPFMHPLQRLEKFLGGLKFAVMIIVGFALCLTVGTFIESYYGTEFVNRFLYKSVPFMVLLFFFYVCVFMAALLRFPPQKRLYGFYTVHLGLITILVGGYFTYKAGIDGTVALYPSAPTRSLTLPTDLLAIRYFNQNKEVTLELPYKATPQKLNHTWEDFRFVRYLPFSEEKMVWESSDSQTSTPVQSSRYQLSNSFASQELTMTSHPENVDFPSSQEMGPLSLHYLPQGMLECFTRATENKGSKLVFWNTREGTCFLPEERQVEIRQTNKKNRFMVLQEGQEFHTFFPDLSPWPLTMDFQINKNSPYRVFSLKLFEEKPTLFLFGEGAGFFSEGKWQFARLFAHQKLTLPWMGFELELLQHETNKWPTLVPYYILPAQDSGKLIRGDLQAVEVEVNHQGKIKTYWVTNSRPLVLLVKGEKVQIDLRKKELTLPYELNLARFKMDKDPGTNNPASYESFVELFNGKEHQSHHIFMNHPLKYDGLTFYQASYFEADNNQFGSVLSVNYDPGRPIKYLGALFLVLGTIWHYLIRRKKGSQNLEAQRI